MHASRSFSRLIFAALFAAVPFVALTGWAQAPAAATQTTDAMPPAPPEDTPIDAGSAVRLSHVEGTVRLSDSTGKLFDQVMENMAMLPGMTLETGSDGRAELQFADGSVARVTPNSALSLSQPSPDSQGRVALLLTPTKGLTYYELAQDGGESVQIGPLTARAQQGLSVGTEPLLRVNLDDTQYQAAALRGSVHFEDASGNAAYQLEAGQTARIDPASATNYDVALDLTPDSWDAWNNDRDAALAQIAGASHPEGEDAGPGWNDLNYYGSWYDVPGVGMAWAPDGVDESFDPYGSGAWGYYTTAGYGWVSSYPWGWLPYHCGVWSHYAGNGWMWLPTGCGWGAGSGWYPYRPIRNAPAGYRPPFRPPPPRGRQHQPLTPALIAVNRGPFEHFRQIGAPRPAASTLVVSGVNVQPLPVEARPAYSSAGSYRSTYRGGSAAVPAQGFVNGAGSGYRGPVTGVAPRIGQAPYVPTYVPAPRESAPRPMAPPPPPPPASHAAAPAAAPAGHGH